MSCVCLCLAWLLKPTLAETWWSILNPKPSWTLLWSRYSWVYHLLQPKLNCNFVLYRTYFLGFYLLWHCVTVEFDSFIYCMVRLGQVHFFFFWGQVHVLHVNFSLFFVYLIEYLVQFDSYMRYFVCSLKKNWYQLFFIDKRLVRF